MIDVKLQYNKLACDLMPFCENIQYTDRKSGSASTLNIVLNNADGRFLRNWAATKGDGITLNFGQAGGITFSVDKITTSFKPSVVTWNCSSRPRTTTTINSRGAGTPPPQHGAIVDEKKTRDTLTNIKFSELLKLIAGECGLKAVYLPKNDPILSYVAQYRESGYDLLTRYAKRYGLELRATATALQIIARSGQNLPLQETFELGRDNIKGVAQNAEIVPKNAVFSRFNPKTGELDAASVGDGVGADADINGILDDVNSVYDQINLSSALTGLDIIPTFKAVAGSLIKIENTIVEVLEMTYNRTGDSETQSLRTRIIQND